MRTIQNLTQGTDAWHQFRLAHFGASEAAAMLGLSPNVTRNELLRAKHTGIAREFSDFVQSRILDKGHAVEAAAVPIVERMLGVELFPATYSDGALSASCDGIDMLEEVVLEHKQWSEALAAQVAVGTVPDSHMPQCQQLLMVTRAQRVIFVVSDGSEQRMVHTDVFPSQEWFERIRAGWDQFARDLAEYSLPASEPAQPIGNAPQTLPALHIEVTGQVTASNLAEFKQTALAAIRSVNRTLTTDQDFSDADKAIKWCGDVESRLAAAKEHALSQTASIDALFKALDDIAAESKRVRLDLDKLVSRRKTEVKEEAVSRARKALDAHIATLNAEIAPVRLAAVPADFAGAIKGKRSISSMQDALDNLLAETKIDADAKARAIRVNLGFFQTQAAGVEFLFADLGQIAHKAADDFALTVKARIDSHKLAEAERKRQAEAAEAERTASLAAAVAAQPPAPAPTTAAVPAPSPAPAVRFVQQVQPAAANEPATLKLGTICDRLGFMMTSAFVAERLGISAAKTEGAAKLYRESDFLRICAALQQHIARAAEQRAAIAA